MQALYISFVAVQSVSTAITIAAIIYAFIVFFQIRKQWKTSSLENLIISLFGCLCLNSYYTAIELTTTFYSFVILFICKFLASTYVLIHVNQLNYSFSGLRHLSLPFIRCSNPKVTQFYWMKAILLIAAVFVLFLIGLELSFHLDLSTPVLIIDVSTNLFIIYMNVLQIVGAVQFSRHSKQMVRTLALLQVAIAVTNALSLSIPNIGLDTVQILFMFGLIITNPIKKDYIYSYFVSSVGTIIQAILTIFTSKLVQNMHKQFVQFTQQANEAEPIDVNG